MTLDTGQHTEDPLLKSLGFPNMSPSSPSTSDPLGINVSSLIGGRKRPSDEGDDGSGPALKLRVGLSTGNSTGGSSSGPPCGPGATTGPPGGSKLQERNKMLASLLAKKPPQPTTIPPIPASVISATPQEILPRVVDRVKQTTGE